MTWQLLAHVVIVCFLSTTFINGEGVDSSTPPDNFDPTKHPNWKLFDTERCGLASSDRIIGGYTATLGSYPWLARLGYYTLGKKSILPVFRCGATVITNYYILSAAHCTMKDPYLSLEVVRLGEFDITTDPDCVGKRCSDKLVDYSVSEIITHTSYGKPLFKNDISLIRTAKEIKFTMYIRPICMTMSTLLTKKFVGESAEVAGWGVINKLTRVGSTKLQVLKVPIVEMDRCDEHFKSYAILGPTQMCAGGNYNQDSCSGDSGGCLMKIEAVDDYPPRYYVIGVVSFGARDCAIADVPAVYTSMAHYMQWMLDRMRP